MRAALLALVTAALFSAVGSVPASAGPYPICLRTMYGDDDCTYTSLQQCRLSASGLGGLCSDNPAYAYAQAYPGDRFSQPRRRHRRSY